MRWPALAAMLPLALAGCEPVKVPLTDDTDTAHTGQPDACDGLPSQIVCEDGEALSCDEAGNIASSLSCDPSAEVCLNGSGCTSCAPSLTLSYADPERARAADIALPVQDEAVSPDSFGWLRAGMRPLLLEAPAAPGGLVTLSADAEGLELYTEDGEALSLPAELSSAALPMTLLVRATGRGRVSLGAAFTGDQGCAAADTLSFRGVGPVQLSGRPRTRPPYWESADTLHDTDALQVTLDPVRWADRVGQPYDAYVVAHKSPAAWAADPSLVDLSGGAEPLVLSADGIIANTSTLWDSGGDSAPDSGDGLGQPYDIVLDFGQDGQLDPGDLIDGLYAERAGVYVLGDLSEAGPHAVERFDHSGGTWLGQRVYYPADIAAMGALPLVVISHGNGHDYRWYDYLGEHLASWGYVVMAHQNDTGPGIETASTTTITNTDYLLSHLDSVGDGVLVGHVDGHTLVWIGHSRGGEGVVRAYDRVVEGEVVPDAFTAEDIALISSIAPTVFNAVTESDPHEVPYHLIAGSADGDVTGGVGCEQCQFFRLAEAARGPVAVTYVHGAGHNDFNCCGFDDAVGPAQIGRAEVQVIARAYFLALIQTVVDGNPATRDYFTRMSDGFRPLAMDPADALATTFRDAHAEGYPVFDDFQSAPDPALSSSGTLVSAEVEDVDEDTLKDQDARFGWSDEDPMNAMTRAVLDSDQARGVVFGFETSASYTVEIAPEMADFSPYGFLSFAVAQQSRHAYTVALDGPLDFTITLTDAQGVESSLNFADQGAAPQPYQRRGTGTGTGWANEFVTVRVPLSDLELGSALDLTRIATLRFDFGEGYGSTPGRISLDNLELSR